MILKKEVCRSDQPNLLSEGPNNSIKCGSNIGEVSYPSSNKKCSLTTIRISSSTLHQKKDNLDSKVLR